MLLGTTTTTPTPTVTQTTPTPTSTATPSSTPAQYQLPACYAAGQNTCNCSDFTTQAWAQWFHDMYDPNDINKLDSDGDGIVCESLP